MFFLRRERLYPFFSQLALVPRHTEPVFLRRNIHAYNNYGGLLLNTPGIVQVVHPLHYGLLLC